MDEKEKQKIIYDGAIKILNTIISGDGFTTRDEQYREEQVSWAYAYANLMYEKVFGK